MITYSFTVTGPPRTKKNSSIAVFRAGGRPRILPSKAYAAWFKNAQTQALLIRHLLTLQGAALPLSGDLRVTALFYRASDIGDKIGYEQALHDWMQEQRFSKPPKPYRITRDGAGIIQDDRQIKDTDGTRLMVDKVNPRIEVTITVLANE